MSVPNNIYCVLIFLLPIGLFSCSEQSETINSTPYSLDFSSLNYPDLEFVNKKYLDGLLHVDKKLIEIQESTGIFCKTDKQAYQPGEVVILTIENKSKWVEYIYPSENSAKKILDTLSTSFNKKSFQKELVSSSPAIKGSIAYNDAAYIHFYISGVPDKVASKYGSQGFSEPLKEDGKIQFHIKMPKRKGRYSFIISLYSHDSSGSLGEGLSGFIQSNVIEVQ